MQQPLDGALLYQVYNVENWTKQGTSFVVGGSFTTVSGVPSQQLQASTNATLGYYNGQMLATSVGNGSGGYAGQTAGALINFDPSSSDTGQAVWNGMVICDPSMKFPLAAETTYPGTILVATQGQGWVLRQQYMYGPGTPATDATLVQTAINTFKAAYTLVQSQCMNSSNAYETIFAY